MAKAPAPARFVTEVAPPQVVSVMRRGKVPRSLDTIAEDDREQLAYGPPPSSSEHLGFAAAWSRRAPARERAAGGFMMRGLSNYFSDAHGQHQAGRRR
ncbi:hypothetical protein SETIT_1G078200v2 [Setaria italica]|uniref:Uncharacterized protein n=1 Tax=Setaria italica TaxID=4555 RepID=K3YX25_SETIT|nr:uncharacterized protein LOC101762879 [Setaria italica]RCV05365.1 hypothetical protein SETIT_1G078200v2 [Setaria italica]